MRKKHGTSYLLGKMRKLRSSQFCFTQKRLIEFQIPDARLPEIVATPFHLLGLGPTSSVCWDASVKVVWEVAFKAGSILDQPANGKLVFSSQLPKSSKRRLNPSSDKTWKTSIEATNPIKDLMFFRQIISLFFFFLKHVASAAASWAAKVCSVPWLHNLAKKLPSFLSCLRSPQKAVSNSASVDCKRRCATSTWSFCRNSARMSGSSRRSHEIGQFWQVWKSVYRRFYIEDMTLP